MIQLWISVLKVNIDDKYSGAKPFIHLKIITASLRYRSFDIGRNFNCLRVGVINIIIRYLPNIIRAVKF